MDLRISFKYHVLIDPSSLNLAWCFLINIYVDYVLVVSFLMIINLIFQVNIIDEPILERFAWCHCWCFHWCAIIVREHAVSYFLGWCYIQHPRIRLTVSRIKSWKRMTLTRIYTSSHLLITKPRIDRTLMQKIIIYHMVISFNFLSLS